MIFFLLCGISLSLDIPGKRIYPSFLAGIAFSLAASFIIKQYFLVFLPVIAVSFGEERTRIPKWLAYFLGLGVGILPLYSYLAYHGIVGDFLFWVIQFNKQIILLSVFLPLIIMLMGGWGVFLLFQRYRESYDQKIFIVLLAFGLSTLSSLTGTVDVNGNHYLAFWFLLAAIVASGCPLEASFQKIKPLFQRSLVYGLLFSFILMPPIARARLLLEKNFEKDKKVMAQLMKTCVKDSCVVIAPLHPVYAWDAVGIYSYWQYDYLRVFPEVKTDVLGRGGILFNIKKQRPAVILCRYHKKDFLLELFQKELISATEYKQLVSYIKANYTQRFIDKESYYMRNDKL